MKLKQGEATGPDATGKPRRVVVHSDGAARGNPGPSGAGWWITDAQGQELARGGVFLGHRTNNEAEYAAALGGLEVARSLGATEVLLKADSELMIRQLTGVYQVKHPRLKPLYDEMRRLIGGFQRVSFAHIPRNQNGEADKEANRAIDKVG